MLRESWPAMATMAASPDLTAEVRMIRAALHRADALLQQEGLCVREFVPVMGVLLAGTDRVAGLLKAQRDITGSSNDMDVAMYLALEELGREWGTDLGATRRARWPCRPRPPESGEGTAMVAQDAVSSTPVSLAPALAKGATVPKST